MMWLSPSGAPEPPPPSPVVPGTEPPDGPHAAAPGPYPTTAGTDTAVFRRYPQSAASSADVERPPSGVNGLAIASVVLSFVGAILFSITFGIIALVQTRRSGQQGRGLAIAGLAISAGWIVLGGLLIAGALLSQAGREDDGQITEAGDVGVFELTVGDCLASVTESERLTHLPAVPCSQPHVGEVYAVFDVPASSYPGTDELVAVADERCLAWLASYSPTAADDPDIEIYYIHPTAQSWRRGDHAITCIAVTETARIGSIQA